MRNKYSCKGIFKMFAVFNAGGRQHKVEKDTTLRINKIEGNPGDLVKFDQVLLIGTGSKDLIVGTPYIKGAAVTGEIISQGRGDKVIIFKKQRRQHYRRKNGHRQYITQVRIKEITKE